MLFLDGSKYTIECHPVGYGRDLLILLLSGGHQRAPEHFARRLKHKFGGFSCRSGLT
jgi:hypothetical protein